MLHGLSGSHVGDVRIAVVGVAREDGELDHVAFVDGEVKADRRVRVPFVPREVGELAAVRYGPGYAGLAKECQRRSSRGSNNQADRALPVESRRIPPKHHRCRPMRRRCMCRRDLRHQAR
jgi:hypothetical protein